MKYYCETISADLAEKLKEKGMPVEIVDDSVEEWPNCKECHCETLYAEVFDWMLGKHEAYVDVFPLRTDDEWRYCGCVQGWGIDTTLGWRGTWHEAANAAIEKALTLI